jgi:TonB family protein
MPDWMKALSVAGLLCLPLAHGVGQDSPPVAVHRAYSTAQSSLEHYRLAESFLQENNLQSAANEFREALNGNQDVPWTAVWSHIKLGIIFDATGQHDRAVNEYRQAQGTGDNTDGALDQANNYLQHAGAVQLTSAHRATAPRSCVEPIQQIDPEYTEEARLAELEGTVVLSGVIDETGLAQNLQVTTPLGLGLDEKALDAAKQWQFAPSLKPPCKTMAMVCVNFRLPSKQSRWHLIGVQFDTPPGSSRPVFMNALYPIGAGIGPEAMEEGRVLVAIGRLATAKLTFDVDEHGVPTNFRIPNASEPVWGSEATALVGQWRFTPAAQNGIPITVPCTIELVWGERELSSDLERQLHDVLTLR